MNSFCLAGVTAPIVTGIAVGAVMVVIFAIYVHPNGGAPFVPFRQQFITSEQAVAVAKQHGIVIVSNASEFGYVKYNGTHVKPDKITKQLERLPRYIWYEANFTTGAIGNLKVQEDIPLNPEYSAEFKELPILIPHDSYVWTLAEMHTGGGPPPLLFVDANDGQPMGVFVQCSTCT
jgi:hypothetical protein